MSLVLVCAADETYVMPMAVTLFSALGNCSADRVAVHILDGGISARSKERVRAVLAPFDVSPCWHRGADDLGDLPVEISYLSTSSYLRVLIPETLPVDLDKAIYLDSDLLVEVDLADLWREDVGDDYLLAAYVRPMKGSRVGGCPELSFGEADGYFNSGVLVMNLPLMRADGIAARAIGFARRWPAFIRFSDQDALNAVCIGRWRPIDGRWNRTVRGDVELGGPSILHFKGGLKPWLVSRRDDGSQLATAFRRYDDFARRSGWFTPAEWRMFVVKRAARQAMRPVRRLYRRL